MSWNRGDSSARRDVSRRRWGVPSVPVVAFVLLALVCGVTLWFSAGRGGDSAPKPRVPRGGGVIAEVRPATSPAGKPPKGTESPRRRSNVPPEQQAMHTNLYGYVINRPSTAVVITNKVDDADRPFEERVFENSADQKIAGLLLLKPGEMLVGDPSSLFGRGFTRAFLKSLESPIIIGKDDDEATAELKRAVRDSKVEIKARHDAGEDIGALMAREYRELQEIGLYKEELKGQIAKLARDKSLGKEDMEDFVKAANMMLAERGGSPLQMPRMAARRFLLEQKDERRTQAAETNQGGVEDE